MNVPTGLQGPTALAYFGGKVKHKIENEGDIGFTLENMTFLGVVFACSARSGFYVSSHF